MLKCTCDYCPLVSFSFLTSLLFYLFLSRPPPPPPPPAASSLSLSLRGLSMGVRERGEWGRQALSWLSWEPLAPCVLGPVLPPLSINLQWQLHCLPNPPRILGDDWPAPLCSINLWPPALRHQSQARGSGLTDWSNRLDTCPMSETELLSHRGNLCTEMCLSWTSEDGDI